MTMKIRRVLPATVAAICLGLPFGAMLDAACAEVRTDTTGWSAFNLSLEAVPAGVDVGALVGHKPAGKFGFLKVQDGRFHFAADKRPVRFWGTNLTKQAAFPPKKDAPRLARHLARLGFNIVRFHHINLTLLDNSFDDTQHLSTETLDRLDFFIFHLKQNGVYVNLNLLTDKWGAYKKGDGVVDYDKLGQGQRVAHFFDARLIELQKQHARQLLTHRNPYTGLSYAADPTVAFIEIINETSFNGSGETGENSKLTPHYANQLNAIFNRWASARYPQESALRKAWGELSADEDLKAGTLRRVGLNAAGRAKTSGNDGISQRVLDTAQFYYDVERNYLRDMVRFLREEAGFKGLINGTNNWYGLSTLKLQTAADFTDMHGYVDHPTFKNGNWSKTEFSILHTPAVNYPEGYALEHPLVWPNILPMHKWSLAAIAGVPLVASEWNWAYPNQYSYEAPLLVSAYGALQGVSGFYQFTYDNALGSSVGFFHLQPNLLVQMPAAALAFRRGDVSEARETVTLEFSDADVTTAQLRYGQNFSHNVQPELPLSTAIVHKIRKKFVGNKAANPLDATRFQAARIQSASQNPHKSDTGELVWDAGDHKRGFVTVNTPRLQGATGFLAGRVIGLKSITLRPQSDGAISAISLDDKPLAQSEDILLTAVGRQENSRQVWADDRRKLLSWGELPVLLEPVKAEIELASARKNLTIVAVNNQGEQLKEIAAIKTPRGFQFSIGHDAVSWYRLRSGNAKSSSE